MTGKGAPELKKGPGEEKRRRQTGVWRSLTAEIFAEITKVIEETLPLAVRKIYAVGAAIFS